MTELTAEERQFIETLVALFDSHLAKLRGLLFQVQSVIETELNEGGRLYELIHSTKSRIQDETPPKKLERKTSYLERSGSPSTENFFRDKVSRSPRYSRRPAAARSFPSAQFLER